MEGEAGTRSELSWSRRFQWLGSIAAVTGVALLGANQVSVESSAVAISAVAIMSAGIYILAMATFARGFDFERTSE